MICGLRIRGYIGFQQVKKEDKGVLNNTNILFKITCMRVSGPFEGCRVVGLDPEKRGGVG